MRFLHIPALGLVVLSAMLAACGASPPLPAPIAEGTYMVSIGEVLLGNSHVRYSLTEGREETLVRIESQSKLEGQGVVVYDSTRVELERTELKPRFSRKIIIAGPERKFASATYGPDSLVTFLTGTPQGEFPLYVTADTLVHDKEQLMLSMGLLGYGADRPTTLRVLSADSQQQLRVVVREQGRESITVPMGTFDARKVRLGVRRHRPPTTFDFPVRSQLCS